MGGAEIKRVSQFKYLGRILKSNDDNAKLAIEVNRKKLKQSEYQRLIAVKS